MNGVILFGVMAMFGFTFSLPGIAGMILTIGMAVDANVLIYERLREEIEGGKSLKNAIAASYEKAFTAIFDSNFTSLITAIILFWMGSGTIKGFAVTLTIGIVASMFSAILVTRVLFRWGIDLDILKKLSFLNLIKATNFDFLGKRRVCAVRLAGLGAGLIRRVRPSSGKGFRHRLHRWHARPIPTRQGSENPARGLEKVLEEIKPTLSKAAYPQEQGNPVSGTLLTVRCDSRDVEKITNKLRESIPALAEKKAESDKDGGHDS